MPDKIDNNTPNHRDDEPLNLDAVRDELGRVPIIGPASDRELFLDLPSAGLAAGGLATRHITEQNASRPPSGNS
jgi:hypothetical protein